MRVVWFEPNCAKYKRVAATSYWGYDPNVPTTSWAPIWLCWNTGIEMNIGIVDLIQNGEWK